MGKSLELVQLKSAAASALLQNLDVAAGRQQQLQQLQQLLSNERFDDTVQCMSVHVHARDSQSRAAQAWRKFIQNPWKKKKITAPKFSEPSDRAEHSEQQQLQDPDPSLGEQQCSTALPVVALRLLVL